MEEYTKYLHDTIYEWVKKNFGESEADDPSWSIEALAEHLAHERLPLYYMVERQFARQDVIDVALDNHMELTNEQVDKATEWYMNSEDYAGLDRETIEWSIQEILRQEDTTQE